MEFWGIDDAPPRMVAAFVRTIDERGLDLDLTRGRCRRYQPFCKKIPERRWQLVDENAKAWNKTVFVPLNLEFGERSNDLIAHDRHDAPPSTATICP